MIDVRVYFEGEVIANITPEEFRKAAKASSRAFLSDVVDEFNQHTAASGDGTRVKLVLRGAK